MVQVGFQLVTTSFHSHSSVYRGPVDVLTVVDEGGSFE